MKIVVVKSCVVVSMLLVVSAVPVAADFTFGRPRNPGPAVNSASQDVSPCISADGLSLYFASDRPGGWGAYDLWVSTRPTTDAPWEPAVNLGPSVNSQYSEMDPSVSSDGLSLYFSDPHNGLGFGARRPGGFAPGDGGNVWVVTRVTTSSPWSAPVNLGSALNSSQYAQVVQPSISADGLFLYVHACADGIGVARRASTADLFGTPELLTFIGNNANVWWPGISADGCALFFTYWTGTTFQLWVTTRPTPDSDFGLPTILPAYLNVSGSYTFGPSLSAEGDALYFNSGQPGGSGGQDLWQAAVLPVVDFNGDWTLDTGDLLRLIESWGRNDPAVDIGPMPWGDGIVDAEDLRVFMEYWGQELPDPALIAHWKLDEGEGILAIDSAGTSNGVLIGNPIWQPTGGKIGGALQLDGVDDCATTAFVCDPSKGPFSVLAWVKGGAPGQVIVSQDQGANWLLTATPEGELTTELKSGRVGPLASAAIVTDGDWHRAGFVYDGSDRILYVDDVEVARDTVGTLAGSTGGLHLGAASTLAPGTFWSGLIDDVRLYDRAVKP